MQKLNGRRGAVFGVRLLERERATIERAQAQGGGPRSIGAWMRWAALDRAAEQCLFAVRGRAPVRRHDVPAVFRAPRGRHSGKPDVFFDLVEGMSFGPRVELFSRVTRIGWHCHGDQVRGRAA